MTRPVTNYGDILMLDNLEAEKVDYADTKDPSDLVHNKAVEGCIQVVVRHLAAKEKAGQGLGGDAQPCTDQDAVERVAVVIHGNTELNAANSRRVAKAAIAAMGKKEAFDN